MASNENSRVDYESGVTPTAMSALTDSGDATVFTSSASQFSESTGNSPIIKPNGLLTGGAVVTGVSTSNDVVDVASLTLNLNGVETSVSAAVDTAITRASTDVASISSVTVASGGSIAVVQGVDSADATFSETRGGAGGPPLIPTDSVELAQVRTTSNVAAAILAAEVFVVVGTHTERADFPVFTKDNATGTVTFDAVLPAIHTGAIPKAVFASYAEPVYTEQRFSNDFVPAETTHSTTSTQVYGDTVGTSSATLNQASFTAILQDGITDAILARKNEILWFRYFQDKFKTANILTQGKLGVSRTFGAADNPLVSCTISPDFASIDKAS